MSEHGQSAGTTNLKELGFQATFAINLRIFMSDTVRAKRYRYFHFDLNAGSGHNELANCPGSPLAFVRGAKAEGCERFHASFVDRNDACVESLLGRHEMHDTRCVIHHGDNSAFIECIPEIIEHYGENPHFVIGTVLSDPNGTDIPLDALAWLAQRCPKLDFIVNFNATATKRSNGAGYERATLLQALERLNKKHWLIREPIGRHQWTMLIGRNIRVGNYRALGFEHLDSDKGLDSIAKAEMTAKDYRAFSTQWSDQGLLF